MQKRLEWLTNNGYVNNNNISHTRTTRFLMPLIGISEFDLEKIKVNLLINAHIKTTEECLIYVVLNRLDFPEEATSFMQLQHLNEHFVDFIEEIEEYIIIYKLPEHFRSDYKLILNGEYSKTSESYKQILLRLHGFNKNVKCIKTTMYDCLYPTSEKRKQIATELDIKDSEIIEVTSKPELTYELFKHINELL